MYIEVFDYAFGEILDGYELNFVKAWIWVWLWKKKKKKFYDIKWTKVQFGDRN